MNRRDGYMEVETGEGTDTHRGLGGRQKAKIILRGKIRKNIIRQKVKIRIHGSRDKGQEEDTHRG